MPKFKIVHGSHVETVNDVQTRHSQGSEFESKFDLDKMFGEKFVRLPDDKPVAPKAKAEKEVK